jgi:hypothetical protein
MNNWGGIRKRILLLKWIVWCLGLHATRCKSSESEVYEKCDIKRIDNTFNTAYLLNNYIKFVLVIFSKCVGTKSVKKKKYERYAYNTWNLRISVTFTHKIFFPFIRKLNDLRILSYYKNISPWWWRSTDIRIYIYIYIYISKNAY